MPVDARKFPVGSFRGAGSKRVSPDRFLYGFKAAPRAARDAHTAGPPLTLPPACASTPVGWREGYCSG